MITYVLGTHGGAEKLKTKNKLCWQHNTQFILVVIEEIASSLLGIVNQYFDDYRMYILNDFLMSFRLQETTYIRPRRGERQRQEQTDG